MFKCLHLILMLGIIKCIVAAVDYDAEFERMERIPGERRTLVDFTKWKIVRVKRDHVLSGVFEYKEDMDDTFNRGIIAEYSPLGNRQFVRSPMKIPNTPICEFHKTYYRKYIQPSFINHTNYPYIPPEGLCPIPKGIYKADNVTIHMKDFPSHVPRGLWKLEETFYYGNELIGGLRLYAWVRDKVD